MMAVALNAGSKQQVGVKMVLCAFMLLMVGTAVSGKEETEGSLQGFIFREEKTEQIRKYRQRFLRFFDFFFEILGFIFGIWGKCFRDFMIFFGFL